MSARLHVYVSSASELATEREAARRAIESMRMVPVILAVEGLAIPYAELAERAMEQSDVFVGIYGSDYGYVAPGADASDIERDYAASGTKPKLIYMRAGSRPDERLASLIDRVRSEDRVSYKQFADADELETLVKDDLALLLTESFEGHLVQPATLPPGIGEIPHLPLSFVGREQELARLETILLGTRLLSMTGPGGIGKSRLAFELARRVGADFPDGVRVVMLGAAHEPSSVVSAVAQVFGVRESSDKPLIDAVIEAVGDASMLVIVDNFEHVIAAAPLISELVSGCPNVKVVVTSRSALLLRGEVEYQVPPLQVPVAAERTDAVELFLDRVRATAPNYEPSEADIEAIGEIARRLDGLPLALELAAARTKLFPPQTMVARLNDLFRFLGTGPRDAPERQRTLQALLDWDYELLDDDERWLLASLAVFASGFTVEAVEIVCAGDISHLDALEGLITKSLIRPDEEVLDEVRFTMMNTVRAYALSKLAERGDLDELMSRHAAHYRSVMEEAAPNLQGREGDRYIRMLRRERHNLRAARLWYSNGDDAEGELRYLAALSPFLSLVGVLSEAQSFLETALSRRRDAPEELRAPVLVEAGSIALEQGEFKRATAFLEEGIDILRRVGHPIALGDALRRLGNVSLDRGDFEKAQRLYEESIALHRGAGNEVGVALALNNLGVITIRTGDPDAAAPLYEEAMSILRRHGVRRPMVSMLINLGEVSFERGRIEDADAYLREAFDVLRADGALWDVAYTLELMAPVCAARGEPRLGAVLFGAAEGLREAVGTPLPPSEQERYSRHVAIVREALGPIGFDAALKEGREMPPADVLRLI